MSITTEYQNGLSRIQEEVKNYVVQKWRDLPAHRSADMNFFIDDILPLVKAGQEHAIALTDAYMSHIMGGSPIGLDSNAIISHIRPGTLPPEVIGRSFETVWSAIESIGYDNALAKGEARLASTVTMDIAMSAREAAKAYGLSSDRVAGFLRRLYPGCCSFCVDIDGAYVRSDDASPLHNNCRCTLVPVEVGSEESKREFTDLSPGSIIGNTEIQEHGELGPMITNKRDHFTGPNAIQK